jgi:hypothetical protein
MGKSKQLNPPEVTLEELLDRVSNAREREKESPVILANGAERARNYLS